MAIQTQRILQFAKLQTILDLGTVKFVDIPIEPFAQFIPKNLVNTTDYLSIIFDLSIEW